MNNEQINKLVDDLEQPAARIRRAICVIRELQHAKKGWMSRADYLHTRVAELETENRRLRGVQGPTELDPRDARIVQLRTELRRLRKLLDDMHAANASPSAIRAQSERALYEHDEYIREQGGEAALKNLRQE